jgi:hypothetical protein
MVKTMKILRLLAVLAVILAAMFAPAAVQAQIHRFEVIEYEVEAYLEADGSLTLYYYMVFQNDPKADPIDFIDLGLPQADYDYKNISGTIDDKPIPEIGPSSYVDGAELALQDLAIQPGQMGTVIVTVSNITGVLFPYDQPDKENYVNFQITPNYFGVQYERSNATKYRMTIILPPEVGTDEGLYYTPSGWPGDETPEASTTSDGRVYYSWYTENANVHTPYTFGAAFPARVVPTESIIAVPVVSDGGGSSGSTSGGSFWDFFSSNFACCLPVLLVSAFSIWAAITNKKKAQKRKLEYMPPKISIEGQGIKRGLTAVEAGILMQEPLDKILTMILFGLLKKEAITITNKDPLTIEPADPLPGGLYAYEKQFIEAFKLPNDRERTKQLQSMMIDLVKSVTEKMKGFSQKETVAYYEDIVSRAWKAVQDAQTPEVKSAQYEHTLEWTMLDEDFNRKTQETLSGGPIIIPRWWWRYDPTFRPSPATSTGGGGGVAAPVSSGGGAGSSKPSVSLPHIPGSDFAASMVNGASSLAAGVIGNITGFTSAITSKTNPVPIQTSSPKSGGGGFRGGGGGGHSCACACACAGCACACAGGGR